MPRLSEYADVLPEGTIDAWPIVAGLLPEGSVLMGGTGLAIWLRHRRSADLDLFAPTRLDPARLVSDLSAAGDFACVEATERMIRGTFNSVNVDIVAATDAHLLGPSMVVSGLRVGSLQDITAGKLSALVSRKQLRDFVDVMFIETQAKLSLEQAIMLYFRRNGLDLHPAEVRGVLGHLVDFRHLENDPAVAAAFGHDIRERVEQYFRSRQPEVAAAFQRLLTA